MVNTLTRRAAIEVLPDGQFFRTASVLHVGGRASGSSLPESGRRDCFVRFGPEGRVRICEGRRHEDR